MTEAISGVPDVMMSYRAEGPQLVNPQVQIDPYMQESQTFAAADNPATSKLIDFTTAANQDFEGKTSVANGSGQLYLSADDAGRAFLGGVGDRVWR